MSGENEAVGETLCRLATEVDQLREHVIYISRYVRGLVEVLEASPHEEDDDDQAVH
jgi:hypothetical protein